MNVRNTCFVLALEFSSILFGSYPFKLLIPKSHQGSNNSTQCSTLRKIRLITPTKSSSRSLVPFYHSPHVMNKGTESEGVNGFTQMQTCGHRTQGNLDSGLGGSTATPGITAMIFYWNLGGS